MLAVPLVQAIVRRWLQSAHILQSAEVASSINQVEFLSANNVRVCALVVSINSTPVKIVYMCAMATI